MTKHFRSYEEFRRRYFPNETEREYRKRLTPEQEARELGKRWAEEALATLREALQDLEAPT